jgi:hypothetical protein
MYSIYELKLELGLCHSMGAAREDKVLYRPEYLGQFPLVQVFYCCSMIPSRAHHGAPVGTRERGRSIVFETADISFGGG